MDCGVLTGTTVSSAIATETAKAAQTNTILFMKVIFDTGSCFLDAFGGSLNLWECRLGIKINSFFPQNVCSRCFNTTGIDIFPSACIPSACGSFLLSTVCFPLVCYALRSIMAYFPCYSTRLPHSKPQWHQRCGGVWFACLGNMLSISIYGLN